MDLERTVLVSHSPRELFAENSQLLFCSTRELLEATPLDREAMYFLHHNGARISVVCCVGVGEYCPHY